METYFIGDTHFNHENIIKYCNRPFTSVEEMNNKIIQNWNNTVGKEDIVYMLGDFCLGNKEQIKEFANMLNGRKYLIIGNHDYYNMKTYMELGFEKAYDKPILYDNCIILSHHPIFTTENSVFGNIYAHVHNDSRYKNATGNTFCVSAERINYTPISYTEIKRRIYEYTEKENTKND